MVSHKSSILKSFIWRLMGIFVYAIIFYIFTHKWQLTMKGTIAHNITFLIVFYLHERFFLWLRKPTHPIKPFTYEIVLGIGLGGLIVYYFTGAWKSVTLITGTYTAIKLTIYYFYEKIWSRLEIKK